MSDLVVNTAQAFWQRGSTLILYMLKCLQPEKPKLTKKKRKAQVEEEEEEYEEKKRKDEKNNSSRVVEEEREKILEVMDNEPDVSQLY